jgi:hypothetical protein
LNSKLPKPTIKEEKKRKEKKRKEKKDLFILGMIQNERWRSCYGGN